MRICVCRGVIVPALLFLWTAAAHAQQAPAVAGMPRGALPVRAPATTTIQGQALTATNGPMTEALVRLRDARFGKIIDSQLSDKSGTFTFRGVDPGVYVAEIMGTDRTTVVAASDLLTVNAGETLSTLVKMPLKVPPFGGVLHSTPAVIAAAAAAAGVLASAPGDAVSPVR